MSAPRKMSPAHRAQAKSLAVAYQGYHESVYRRDHHGTVLWGTMLEEAQAATGITLHSERNLSSMIALARIDEARSKVAA